MVKDTGPIELFQDSVRLHHVFEETTQPFRLDLWRYCVSLTGSQWDGEDLFQETLIKAYGSLFQRAYSPTNIKSYIFRMATNQWIDECRKRKIALDEWTDEEGAVEQTYDSFELTLGVTFLTTILTPRQAAALLLVDVLGFHAGEAAGMLQTSVQSIYSSIKRARNKLAERKNDMKDFSISAHSSEQEKVIQAYLNAMQEGDVEGVLALYSDHITNDTRPGFQEFTKEEVRKGSLQYGFSALHAERRLLWGRHVMIKLVDTEAGPALHDVQFQQVEDGKIVYHRSYFFCREFLTEAAKELNVAVQRRKPPVDWSHID